ncbi:hypothetical protein OIU84_002995 [Salix udensis]|uniref:FBD domain-containing protein n=1 Tax=Salix udensis TaxID=889485 RepID=A0AAD6K5V4_9ROSI|nr:hypothetical protein OIU84_002995 [Salix udensis]
MEETASGYNCQNLCEKANEDVISELRDDILCYMLSFLPTKSAVATSILSTRWRNLWKSVTILDIYDGISDLALSYDFSCANAWMTHLSRWISSSAIMGNVEELIFSINFPVRLPENLYCCEKLVALKLHGHIRFDNLQSVCLPSLKALHLEHLRMLNNTAIEVLLSGSPALEELELEMEGRDSRRSVHRADSLRKADLCFGYQEDVFNVGIEEYANMVVQFYRQISGVKTLSLSNFNIQTLLGAAVSKFPCLGNLPTFRNLIHLEVRVGDEYVWILPEILQCCSDLEVFVLILVIEYKVFQGESGETEMLEYFLSNALVLKKMTITHPHDLETLEVDVLKRLSTCPKGSDACQIVLIPEHKRSFEVASMRRASFFSESFNY